MTLRSVRPSKRKRSPPLLAAAKNTFRPHRHLTSNDSDGHAAAETAAATSQVARWFVITIARSCFSESPRSSGGSGGGGGGDGSGDGDDDDDGGKRRI